MRGYPVLNAEGNRMADKPNPGSDEAIKQGCICAVLDNRHGKGAYNFEDGVFWITEGCPIHAPIGKE